MLLMIDNYDSFTYNLVHYFQELGAHVKVVRNDQIGIKEITELNPKQIVISPGPGCPKEAGISLSVIKHFSDQVPILGICLGHQAIAEAYGSKIIQAKELIHGKVSPIYHAQKGCFHKLKTPLSATRYHSLVINRDTLSDPFEITAWTKNEDGTINEVMGIKHRTLPLEGVQFHPESVLTEEGHTLLNNFLRY